jgi:hypothetical protein
MRHDASNLISDKSHASSDKSQSVSEGQFRTARAKTNASRRIFGEPNATPVIGMRVKKHMGFHPACFFVGAV